MFKNVVDLNRLLKQCFDLNNYLNYKIFLNKKLKRILIAAYTNTEHSGSMQEYTNNGKLLSNSQIIIIYICTS